MAENIAELSIKVSVDGSQVDAELKRTADSAKKSTDKIANETEKNVKKTSANFEQLASTLKKVAAAYISFSAFKSMVQNYTAFNTQLSNSATLLNMEVSQLSAMSRAMERFGGDMNSVSGAMKSMNSHLQAAKFGGGALIDVARKYGIQISAYQSADKALFSLAKQMQGFSHQTKIAIMQQMGLDEAMQRALLDGGAELERQIMRQRKLGLETEEDTKNTTAFNNAMLDLRDAFTALSRELMRYILPFLKTLSERALSFVEALRKNKAFAFGFFAGLAVLMLPILVILAKMAIATVIAFAPFFAIAGAIVAIVAIVEDLYYYFMGWDSVTGDLVKKFPWLAKLIEPVRPVVMTIVEIVQKLLNLFKNPSWAGFRDLLLSIFKLPITIIEYLLTQLRNLFSYLSEMGGPVGAVFGAISKGIDIVLSGIQMLKEWISSLTWDGFKQNAIAVFTAIGQFFTKIIDNITGVLNSVVDKVKGFANSVASFFGFGDDESSSAAAATAPAVPQSAAIVNNSSAVGDTNTTYNINQNITAPSPQVAANASANAIKSVSAQRQNVGGK